MLWNLDGTWLTMAVAAVVVLSYFFGAAMDALVREDGFGATGNAAILASGFFLAILAVNYEGHALRELHFAVMVGLAGAFVGLTALTLVKALIARL
jgi:hypothetical protein